MTNPSDQYPLGMKLLVHQFVDDDEEIVPCVVVGEAYETDPEWGNSYIYVPVHSTVDGTTWETDPAAIMGTWK
jgi:hypothetical protein